MKMVIKELQEKVAGMRKGIADYRKWIAECRKNKHDYGVESYTESMNELKAQIPQYSEAIKILKRHNHE